MLTYMLVAGRKSYCLCHFGSRKIRVHTKRFVFSPFSPFRLFSSAQLCQVVRRFQSSSRCSSSAVTIGSRHLSRLNATRSSLICRVWAFRNLLLQLSVTVLPHVSNAEPGIASLSLVGYSERAHPSFRNGYAFSICFC